MLLYLSSVRVKYEVACIPGPGPVNTRTLTFSCQQLGPAQTQRIWKQM